MPDEPLILLSFDVEEFDAPLEFGQNIAEDDQFRIGAAGLRAVLDLMERLDITATFFTTANFALHEPDLIRRLVERHELASHGYWHSAWEDADLLKSRQTLEEVGQTSVIGFRRARLQPTSHEAIRNAGYRYNSSENPIWLPGRYNNLFKQRTAYFDGELLNVPISASPVVRVPLFWLGVKNFPMPMVRSASARCLSHDRYLNIFFHPWEFVDLSDWALPGYAKRHSGQPMLDRLAGYVTWLKGCGRFATMREFDERMREAQTR